MEFTVPVPEQNEILGQFSNKWNEFVNQFNCYKDPSGQTKTSFLLHYGAQTIKEIQLSNKIPLEEFTRFIACVERLEVKCMFQIVIRFLRHLFFTRCRQGSTSMEEFYTELSLLSNWCSFDDSTRDNLIKKQLISNIRDESARDVLLSVNDLTIANVLDICRVAEKQNMNVTLDMINLYLVEQQQQSSDICNPVTNAQKDFGWSTVSFTETHETTEMTDGLNISSLFESVSVPDAQCVNASNFGMKQSNSGNRSKFFTNLNGSSDHVVISDSASSVFVNDKIPRSSTTISQTIDPEPVTHFTFTPLFESPTSCAAVPFQNSQQTPVAPAVTVSNNSDCQELDHPKIQHSESQVADLLNANSASCSVSIIGDDNKAINGNDGDTSVRNNDGLLMSLGILNPPDDESNNEVDDQMDPVYSINQGVEKQNSSSNSRNHNISEDYGSIEIPSVFISQQSAIWRTSQVDGVTGQAIDSYSCNLCSFMNTSKVIMKEHAMQIHASMKCYVCTACHSKFPLKEQVDSHIQMKHLNVEEHKCHICDQVFTSQRKLLKHLHGHVDTNIVSCAECNAIFSSGKLHYEHMLEAHPFKERWVCRICDAAFPVRKELSDHVSEAHKNRRSEDILVNEKRTFPCKQCSISFADSKSMKAHHNKYHPKRPYPAFPCDLCDHVSNCRSNLISHQRVHTGEKPYMCEICAKKFSQTSSLDKHMRTHTGEKPFKCQYCDTAFSVSSNRLMHERLHRKERPYICEHCGKTYRNSYELKVHIKTHTQLGTKKFKCHCGSAFDTQRKLSRHKVCHSGRKPHSCETCGAGFTRLENLRGHQKSQACRNRVLKLQ